MESVFICKDYIFQCACLIYYHGYLKSVDITIKHYLALILVPHLRHLFVAVLEANPPAEFQYAVVARTVNVRLQDLHLGHQVPLVPSKDI